MSKGILIVVFLLTAPVAHSMKMSQEDAQKFAIKRAAELQKALKNAPDLEARDVIFNEFCDLQNNPNKYLRRYHGIMVENLSKARL